MHSLAIDATTDRKPGFGARIYRRVQSALLSMALAYLAVCGGVCAWQSHLIFKPDQQLRATPANFNFPVIDIAIPLRDGGTPAQFLHGWWIPSGHAAAKTLLYLHGNDGNVSTNMGGIEPLRRLGYEIFMLDYRGYGESGGGFPSEAGVYQDAQTAWDYLVHTRGIKPSDILIYGHSLGGAVAIDLATRHADAAGLVVESSFTSIREMAGLDRLYALLPLDLIVNQRFDSIDKVRRLRLPVLYVHGTGDELVPFDMGRALYRATPSAVDFVAVVGGGHEGSAAQGDLQLRAAINHLVHHSLRAPAPLAVIHAQPGHS